MATDRRRHGPAHQAISLWFTATPTLASRVCRRRRVQFITAVPLRVSVRAFPQWPPFRGEFFKRIGVRAVRLYSSLVHTERTQLRKIFKFPFVARRSLCRHRLALPPIYHLPIDSIAPEANLRNEFIRWMHNMISHVIFLSYMKLKGFREAR